MGVTSPQASELVSYPEEVQVFVAGGFLAPGRWRYERHVVTIVQQASGVATLSPRGYHRSQVRNTGGTLSWRFIVATSASPRRYDTGSKDGYHRSFIVATLSQVRKTRGYHSSTGISAGGFIIPRRRRYLRHVGPTARLVSELAGFSPRDDGGTKAQQESELSS